MSVLRCVVALTEEQEKRAHVPFRLITNLGHHVNNGTAAIIDNLAESSSAQLLNTTLRA